MKPSVIECGVAVSALAGQVRSGDLHLVHPSPSGVLLAVADGIGHGEEAALVAERAIATARQHAHEPLITLVKRCHDRLRETRGVVMSLAALNAQDGTLTWMGIGNVEGLLLRPTAAPSQRMEVLLLRGGVIGVQLPPLQASILPITAGDTLLFVTDGIGSAFATGLSATETPQKMADRILTQYKKGSDDALVLVARYTGHGQS